MEAGGRRWLRAVAVGGPPKPRSVSYSRSHKTAMTDVPKFGPTVSIYIYHVGQLEAAHILPNDGGLPRMPQGYYWDRLRVRRLCPASRPPYSPVALSAALQRSGECEPPPVGLLQATVAPTVGARTVAGAGDRDSRVWYGLDQSAGFIIQSSPGGFGLDWIRNSPTQRILDWTGSINV